MTKGTEGPFPLGILSLKHFSYIVACQNNTGFPSQDRFHTGRKEKSNLTY